MLSACANNYETALALAGRSRALVHRVPGRISRHEVAQLLKLKNHLIISINFLTNFLKTNPIDKRHSFCFRCVTFIFSSGFTKHVYRLLVPWSRSVRTHTCSMEMRSTKILISFTGVVAEYNKTFMLITNFSPVGFHS